MTEPAAAPSGSSRVAAGIGVSRAFGLVREILIAAVLGATVAGDAFRAAMRIPNIIQNLLGEGALGASFVPVYAKLVEERNEAEARRVAGGVLGMLTASITMVVAILVLAADPLISLLASGLAPEVHTLAVRLTRITTLGIGLLGLSAWALAILNSHRQYFLGYAAPALWNLAQIGLLLVVGLVTAFGDGGPDADRVAVWLAIAVLAGSALQLGVMVPRVRVLTQGVTPHLRREGETRMVIKRFVPAVGARGVVQISSLIDLQLVSYLAVGAISIWALALPLYLLPIGVFGFSVATAELTEMSRQSDRAMVVAGRVRLGLRKVVLAAGLSTAVLLFAGRSLAGALYLWPNELFDRQSFSGDDTIVLGWTLAAYALALPAAMTARVTQNALFALGDVGTPARIAVIRLFVSLAASLLLIFAADRLVVSNGQIGGWDQVFDQPPWQPLAPEVREAPVDTHMGPVGLGLAAMVASWVEWVLLRRGLRRRIGPGVGSGLGLAVTASAAAAGVTVWAVQALLPLGNPIEGIMVGVVAMAVYIGALRFQGLRPRSAPSPNP